jgi:MoaA/NifB/PqqE/SkfB family radical SAM enzyme
VTNASLLYPETSKELIGAGLDRIKISFNGTDEESYISTMKRLSFKETYQNITEFLRIRKDMKRENPRLIIQYLPIETNHASTKEFQALWSPVIDTKAGDCLHVSSLHNYGGGRAHNRLGGEIASVCYFPWTSMSVLWDGRVVTCCMDSNGVQLLGDLNIQSLQDLWNGPALSGVRDDFRRREYGKYPVCLSCDWVHRR